MNKSFCPSCKKREGVPLVWGFPNDDVLQRASRREVILSGTVINDQNVNRQCRCCGHSWRSALLPDAKIHFQSVTKVAAKTPKELKSRNRAKTRVRVTQSRAATTFGVARVQSDIEPVETTQSQSSKRTHMSFIPTIFVFVLSMLIAFAVAGVPGCSDGWASGSIGRPGACSHHGGVAKWPRVLAFVFSALVAMAFHRFRVSRQQRK